MAGNTPTLTNENFHMFEPSNIETSLVNALANKEVSPNIFPLLAQYQAKNQMNNNAYQSQIDQMHANQMDMFKVNTDTARKAQLLSGLKDAGGAPPGMLKAMMTGGMIPANMDVSDFDTGIAANAQAKNMGEAGRGIGSAAMGGITGLAPAAQATFGPTAGQGPPAIVQAAQVKEAGANARHASGGGDAKFAPTLNLGLGGGDAVTMKLHPGETPQQGLARAGITSLPNSSGLSSTPAPKPRVGGDNVKTPPPSPTAQPQKHSAVDTMRNLPLDQQRDVLAAASSNGNNYKIVNGPSGPALMGISGQLYPIGVV